MKFNLILCALALGASAHALTKAGEILQIDSTKNMAVVQIRAKNIQPGNTLIATAKDKTQCGLPVKTVVGTTAIVETAECSFGAHLRVGQPLELSVIGQAQPVGDSANQMVIEKPVAAAKAAPAPEHKTYVQPTVVAPAVAVSHTQMDQVKPQSPLAGLSAFGFYDVSNNFKGSLHSGNTSGDATINSNSALGVGAEYAQYRIQDQFGFYGDVAYEMGRDFKSLEFQGSTGVFQDVPTMTVILLGAGGNYRLNDQFYAKGGLNYNLPSISGGGSLSAIGRLGYEGGVGAQFNQNFSAELLYRRLNYSLTAKQGSEVAFSIDDLQSSGFLLRGAYIF